MCIPFDAFYSISSSRLSCRSSERICLVDATKRSEHIAIMHPSAASFLAWHAELAALPQTASQLYSLCAVLKGHAARLNAQLAEDGVRGSVDSIGAPARCAVLLEDWRDSNVHYDRELSWDLLLANNNAC